MPDNQLPDASGLYDYRLGVALLGIGWQGAPSFLAGQLNERHHLGVRLDPDDGDHAIPLDQCRAGDAPTGHLHAVILYVVHLPDYVAGPGVQAKQPTGPSDDVDSVAVHGWRRTRAGGITDALVVHWPLARPQDPAGLFIQCERALRPLHSGRRFEICDEHPSTADGRSGEPGVYWRPPGCREPVRGEVVQDAGLAPDAVSPFAAPLRPVIR